MSLFEQFPYTNFHEINLDWLIQQVKNYGESVVLSVNGQTGDVVLYQDPNIQFPAVDSTNWTMTRTANGHTIGIQFQNGLAYLLFDGSTERIYTTGNPPEYPVTSVDGQTGAVQVFPNADTVLPPVNNTRTIMRRQIKDGNNQDIFTGVQAEADALKRLSGTNLYTIYDQQNQPPYPVTSVNGQTGAVILAIPFADVSGQEWTASADSPSNIWEMSRYTQNGALATIRLTTANGLTEGYLEYFDEGTQTTVTKKILTTDDIPSSAGVVSLNGLTGVVTLYGNTMDLYSGSPDTVKDAVDYTRSSVAYREDGATASQNIPIASYVIWQGDSYISTAAISSGDTLSGSNLTTVPEGCVNGLYTKIKPVTLLSLVSADYTTNPQTFPLSEAFNNFEFLLIRGSFGTSAERDSVMINTSDILIGSRSVGLNHFNFDSVTPGNPNVGTAAYYANITVSFPTATSVIIESTTNNANYQAKINRIYGIIRK